MSPDSPVSHMKIGTFFTIYDVRNRKLQSLLIYSTVWKWTKRREKKSNGDYCFSKLYPCCEIVKGNNPRYHDSWFFKGRVCFECTASRLFGPFITCLSAKLDSRLNLFKLNWSWIFFIHRGTGVLNKTSIFKWSLYFKTIFCLISWNNEGNWNTKINWEHT